MVTQKGIRNEEKKCDVTEARGLMYLADWTRGLDSRTELETAFKQ